MAFEISRVFVLRTDRKLALLWEQQQQHRHEYKKPEPVVLFEHKLVVRIRSLVTYKLGLCQATPSRRPAPVGPDLGHPLRLRVAWTPLRMRSTMLIP